MFIQWNDKLKIGVKEIDNEHRAIIDEFEELYKRMKEGKGHEYYNELLIFLDSYVNTHFTHEEVLHDELNYVNMEEHKRIHDGFRDKVKLLIKQHENSEITNLDLIEMNLFVKNWLINHIMVEDKKFGEFKRNMNGDF